SGGSSGGNGSGNASDSGGSSSSSGSGGSSEPSAPVHTHSYTIPVWGTVQEGSDGQGYSCETYYTCNGCGENWPAAHAAENAKKGDNSHGTYTVHNRESWTKEPGYYPVDKIVGYKCSCGAVQ